MKDDRAFYHMILSLQGYVLPKIPVVCPGTVDWCLMFMYSANSVFFPRPQRKNTCRSNLDWIIKHACLVTYAPPRGVLLLFYVDRDLDDVSEVNGYEIVISSY